MRNDQSTMLRWPSSLRQAVAEEARKNRRSINSEILARLEASFGGLEWALSHLMPCTCGAGRPDVTWCGSGQLEAHHVQCPCGNGVTDGTEHGAAVKWNALMRSRRAAA
ncbi:MAG: Arc family DNA-binding protein [Rhodobacterales bacterium]|nr:Arc family DNA-binding protein [Rhodobacterales bacterium]